MAPSPLHGQTEDIKVKYDPSSMDADIIQAAVELDNSGFTMRSANEVTMDKSFNEPRVSNVTQACEVTLVASIPQHINPQPSLKWFAFGKLQKTGGTKYVHSARYT